jgi:hypothetical protein
MHIGPVGRLVAGAFVLAIAAAGPAHSQLRPSQCVSEFSRDDGDGDGKLAGPEAARYRNVMMYVDVNGDGDISNAEFMTACDEGVFASYRDRY